MWPFRRWNEDDPLAWCWPAALGLGAALLLWVVWYFTKAPCTIENASAGLCNASVAARFINHQILAQCILLGLAVAAVKGGYDEIMVSRERKRADEAEERLRFERKRADEMMEEIRAERREELQAWRQERREELEARREEREADRLARQALMEVITQMSNAIEQLLERRNGRPPED